MFSICSSEKGYLSIDCFIALYIDKIIRLHISSSSILRKMITNTQGMHHKIQMRKVDLIGNEIGLGRTLPRLARSFGPLTGNRGI